MRTPWLRRIAYIVGGIAALLLVFVGTVYAVTAARTRQRYDEVAAAPVPVSTDSATVARGGHLVEVIGKCSECHGADYGGKVFVDDPALGRVVATNLTTGGALGTYSDAEFARAVRHGVARDGRGLMIMPSRDYNTLADADVGAMIAYLRTRPAVQRTLPANDLHLLARVLWATGQLPLIDAAVIDHARPSIAAMPAAATAEYGKYLADAGGCTGCHGPGLSGGKIPGTPPEWKPAANLTPSGAFARWSEEEFKSAMRTGRRPDGTPIDTTMPWKATGKMHDDEMHAVYTYLKSVPSRAAGTR